MASLGELAKRYATLEPDEINHLQRLVGSWSMLSDLSFADLILLLPIDPAEPTQQASTHHAAPDFLVLAQTRPTTNQTCHPNDLTGQQWTAIRTPVAAQAWSTMGFADGVTKFRDGTEQAQIRAIPVRHNRKPIAILVREQPTVLHRQPGELERIYVDTSNIIFEMIAAGDFPFSSDALGGEESPRVGDGTIVFDADEHIQFASPNAMNALHRLGISSNVLDQSFLSLGIHAHAVRSAMTNRLPATEELEPAPGIVVRIHCIPLLRGGIVVGALGLLRDITDVKRLDRLLLSKDAAIREVHHRVKNNLQTISALLRLQSRRLASPDGRLALDEAERRIRAIALVHEFLSRDPSDQVPFGQILSALVRMAEEGLTSPEFRIAFKVIGDPGELDAEVATPLAVVLTELLQNAVEHAFPSSLSSPDGTEGRFLGEVVVELNNDGTTLVVRVEDNGSGIPVDFSVQTTTSLGLSIVRDLVRTQLGGTITMDSLAPERTGTRVAIEIPLTQSPTRESTIT